jgi:hypothetical protein
MVCSCARPRGAGAYTVAATVVADGGDATHGPVSRPFHVVQRQAYLLPVLPVPRYTEGRYSEGPVLPVRRYSDGRCFEGVVLRSHWAAPSPGAVLKPHQEVDNGRAGGAQDCQL